MEAMPEIGFVIPDQIDSDSIHILHKRCSAIAVSKSYPAEAVRIAQELCDKLLLIQNAGHHSPKERQMREARLISWVKRTNGFLTTIGDL